MKNTELIRNFYDSFCSENADGMIDCYHEKIVFEDPAFGKLEEAKAKNMWKMLLTRSKGNIQVKYSNVEFKDNKGFANWTATYNYGPKKRKVVNHVKATFEFSDGKIIRHTDVFDLWKWTKQALGLSGYLLGWSSFMKNKIQKSTNKMLDDYALKMDK